MSLRKRLSRYKTVWVLRGVATALRDQFGFNLRWLHGLRAIWVFSREYDLYRQLVPANPQFSLTGDRITPCLSDRTRATPVEPVYFLQDTWFARKIAEACPERHVDVGSSAKSLALIAQFVPVTFVDIRSVDLVVPGFTFLTGSILDLPFADASIRSLSSICVIEHIGLGRYGDPFDAYGSEKAARELGRVLARGGRLYLTVPVDGSCRIYFNAHRAFTREYVLTLFHGLNLLEERYIYGCEMVPEYRAERGFGTGLFAFEKP